MTWSFLDVDLQSSTRPELRRTPALVEHFPTDETAEMGLPPPAVLEHVEKS